MPSVHRPPGLPAGPSPAAATTTVMADLLTQLEAAAAQAAFPPVQALHLPPDPPPGSPRGEFCALVLADGSPGLSYVLLDDTLARLRAGGAGRPGAGADALALLRRGAQPGAALTDRVLGLAAANALTACLYRRAGWQPPASVDSLGGLQPGPGDHIGMIGLFTPLLGRLLASGARLTVVELKAHLVGTHDGYRVTLDAAELGGCNKVLGTGTLLINHTLDAMLAHSRAAAHVALIGPTLGCLPDALWLRGVRYMGGSWVLDTAAYVDALLSGEPRPGLAQKVGLTPDNYPGLEALRARW